MHNHALGGRIIQLNVLRRNLFRKKSAGCALYDGQRPMMETIVCHPGCTQLQGQRCQVTAQQRAQLVEGFAPRHKQHGARTLGQLARTRLQFLESESCFLQNHRV